MKNDFRLSLLELNSLVRELIERQMPDEYWVEAELSECRESRGHCYMELIQRDERSNTPVARASAKCWASKWLMIRPYFERTTGQVLRAGMKVLLRVYPQFHEAYGFSWIVTDIDPNYTLGDQARRRMEIIRQLKEEGVFDLQRELQLPLFCLHIAVISSQTAAGYGDFCNQLADSPFAFRTQLFPATMQGEGVEQSIINALERIYESEKVKVNNEKFAAAIPSPTGTPEGNSSLFTHHSSLHFDCVVIIRGGGATSDMSGFDTLLLAENVANFPLPIITGIGHDRDESILDMVSHQRVKTPTAAAAFLIDHAQKCLDAIDDAQTRMTRYALQRLADHKSQISNLKSQIRGLFSIVKTRQEARLDALYNRMLTRMQQQTTTARATLNLLESKLPLMAERRLQAEHHRIALIEERLKALDPQLLLSRGYSITTKDGRAVRDPSQLKPGDQIETRLEKGTIKSTVI